jgi:hypothetical protein
MLLRGKGYNFSLRESGKLLLFLRPRRSARLPAREEFAVLPDYGEGSCKEIVALIRRIEAMQKERAG